MNSPTTTGWGELFLAEAGASAALAGLLFVAVSINLDRILARGVAGIAIEAIVLLIAVLVVATVGLTPLQPAWVLGVELLVVGLAVWSILSAIHIRALRSPIAGQPPGLSVVLLIVVQIGTIPFIVAGASVLLGAGGGLYWLVPAMVFSLVVAVINAWLLLVEIAR
jgi:hypothetical protein